MQNVKQVPEFKLLSTSVLALFTMVLLVSCSKSKDEMPSQDYQQLTAANDFSQSSIGNSLVAVPFERTVFVPCANGGAGEDVVLTGSTNFVYQIIWNDHLFSLTYHDNHHQVTGVGLSSGDTFVASGGTEGKAAGSWVNNQWIGTTIQQLRIIGQNSSFIVKYKYHLTVTPDGNITVKIIETTVDCNE